MKPPPLRCCKTVHHTVPFDSSRSAYSALNSTTHRMEPSMLSSIFSPLHIIVIWHRPKSQQSPRHPGIGSAVGKEPRQIVPAHPPLRAGRLISMGDGSQLHVTKQHLSAKRLVPRDNWCSWGSDSTSFPRPKPSPMPHVVYFCIHTSASVTRSFDFILFPVVICCSISDLNSP